MAEVWTGLSMALSVVLYYSVRDFLESGEVYLRNVYKLYPQFDRI
jgi:hypothetical protein